MGRGRAVTHAHRSCLRAGDARARKHRRLVGIDHGQHVARADRGPRRVTRCHLNRERAAHRAAGCARDDARAGVDAHPCGQRAGRVGQRVAVGVAEGLSRSRAVAHAHRSRLRAGDARARQHRRLVDGNGRHHQVIDGQTMIRIEQIEQPFGIVHIGPAQQHKFVYTQGRTEGNYPAETRPVGSRIAIEYGRGAGIVLTHKIQVGNRRVSRAQYIANQQPQCIEQIKRGPLPGIIELQHLRTAIPIAVPLLTRVRHRQAPQGHTRGVANQQAVANGCQYGVGQVAVRPQCPICTARRAETVLPGQRYQINDVGRPGGRLQQQLVGINPIGVCADQRPQRGTDGDIARRRQAIEGLGEATGRCTERHAQRNKRVLRNTGQALQPQTHNQQHSHDQRAVAVHPCQRNRIGQGGCYRTGESIQPVGNSVECCRHDKREIDE